MSVVRGLIPRVITDYSLGFADYNDLATQTTPLSIVGEAGYVSIPNDTLGASTKRDMLPSGVTDIWVNNGFDWSQLTVGSMLDMRIDLDVTTTSTHTEIDIDLELATPIGNYSIPFVIAQNFKKAGTYRVISYGGIYIGSAETLAGNGTFRIKSDKDCSVVVNGWYCQVQKRL